MSRAVSSIPPLLCATVCCMASWAYASIDGIPPGSFRLETDAAERVSLSANDADLNEILSQLGRELDIEVTSSLPADARVTLAFSDLPLTEALKRMAGSYMLVADEVDGRVARIFVLPEGDGSYEGQPSESESGDDDSRPAGSSSFQFEFDPNTVPVEDEDDPVPSGE